jgi:hypothetical protein
VFKMSMTEAYFYAGLIAGQVLVHLAGRQLGYGQHRLGLLIVGLVVGMGLGWVLEKVARASQAPPRDEGPSPPPL